MPVTRRVKRQRTTAIDRILQLISVGAGVARTGFGIKAGIESGKRAETTLTANLEQQELTRLQARQTDILAQVDARHEQDLVDFFRQNPGEVQSRSREMFEGLKDFPFNADPTTQRRALLAGQFANGIFNRNDMVDATNAPEMLVAAHNLGQEEPAEFREELREILRRTKEIQLGRPVDISEITDDTTIHAGRDNLGAEMDQGFLLNLLSSPDGRTKARATASYRFAAKQGFAGLSTEQMFAKMEMMDQRRTEARKLLMSDNPAERTKGALIYREDLGIPLPRDQVVNFSEEQAGLVGGTAAFSFVYNDEEMAEMAQKYAAAGFARQVGQKGEATRLLERAHNSRIDFLSAEGRLKPPEAVFITLGAAENYGTYQIVMAQNGATEDQILSEADWNRSPYWNELRRIDALTNVHLQVAKSAEFAGNAAAANPVVNAVKIMMLFKKENGKPANPLDMNDWINATPMMEAAKAGGQQILIPTIVKVGLLKSILEWPEIVTAYNWINQRERAGALSLAGPFSTDPIRFPEPGTPPQSIPRDTDSFRNLRATAIVELTTMYQQMSQTDREKRVALLQQGVTFPIKEGPMEGQQLEIKLTAEEAERMLRGNVNPDAVVVEPSAADIFFDLREQINNLQKTKAVLLVDPKQTAAFGTGEPGPNDTAIANLEATIAKIEAEITAKQETIKTEAQEAVRGR